MVKLYSGDIIWKKGIVFKNSRLLDTRRRGHPILILNSATNPNDIIYFLILTSNIKLGTNHFYFQLPEKNYTSYINLNYIYKASFSELENCNYMKNISEVYFYEVLEKIQQIYIERETSIYKRNDIDYKNFYWLYGKKWLENNTFHSNRKLLAKINHDCVVLYKKYLAINNERIKKELYKNIIEYYSIYFKFLQTTICSDNIMDISREYILCQLGKRIKKKSYEKYWHALSFLEHYDYKNNSIKQDLFKTELEEFLSAQTSNTLLALYDKIEQYMEDSMCKNEIFLK